MSNTDFRPVNEESGLTVSCVACVISSSSFNKFPIEVVRHLGFGVAIYKPEEIAVVILYTILCVMLLSQEPANTTTSEHSIPSCLI